MDKRPTVSFSTGVWEGTYIPFLLQGGLQKQLDAIKGGFDEYHLIVNNVSEKSKIVIKEILAEKYPQFKCFFVEDNAKRILKFFKIDMDEHDIAYVYTIQHLAKLYHTKCDYLFNLSEDCYIGSMHPFFISSSIFLMDRMHDVICTMPSWDASYIAPKMESITETNDFYISYGFTDQVYFAKVEEFRKPIYNHVHSASNRYPAYGGNCFERRVDSYMQTFHRYRGVSKDSYYIHGG